MIISAVIGPRASGKTTIAKGIKEKLEQSGSKVQIFEQTSKVTVEDCLLLESKWEYIILVILDNSLTEAEVRTVNFATKDIVKV